MEYYSSTELLDFAYLMIYEVGRSTANRPFSRKLPDKAHKKTAADIEEPLGIGYHSMNSLVTTCGKRKAFTNSACYRWTTLNMHDRKYQR